LIYNGAELPVHLRDQVWVIKPKLDISAMKKAAKSLIGKHDFSSFCASGTQEKNFVRQIYSVQISKKQISCAVSRKLSAVSIKFKGNAFLYKMIRNIVGTLVQAGLGKLPPSEMENIVKARDRRRAGKCAPPQGLYLIRVNY
jgi:tRNA pseudouridine38-40 synthase